MWYTYDRDFFFTIHPKIEMRSWSIPESYETVIYERYPLITYYWTVGEFRFDRTIRSEKYRIPDIWDPILDVRHPMSDEHHPNFGKNLLDLGRSWTWYRISDVRYQVSNVGYRVSDVQYWVSDVRYRVSDVQYRVLDVQDPISDEHLPDFRKNFWIWEEKRSDIRSGCRTQPNLNSPNSWIQIWLDPTSDVGWEGDAT